MKLHRSTPVIKFVFRGGKGTIRVCFRKRPPPVPVIYCLYVGTGAASVHLGNLRLSFRGGATLRITLMFYLLSSVE